LATSSISDVEEEEGKQEMAGTPQETTKRKLVSIVPGQFQRTPRRNLCTVKNLLTVADIARFLALEKQGIPDRLGKSLEGFATFLLRPKGNLRIWR